MIEDFLVGMLEGVILIGFILGFAFIVFAGVSIIIMAFNTYGPVVGGFTVLAICTTISGIANVLSKGG